MTKLPGAPPVVRRVALVGNPNAGKTTLFNALTGMRQKVANYAGVTVERAAGRLRGTPDVEIADVPGLYSLTAVSEDERVAIEEIENEADLLVVVVDATNLERNLYLVTQLAERGRPMLVVLTMADRLKVDGATLDVARLGNLLGCEVVAIDGRRDASALPVAAAIERNLADPRAPKIDLGNDPRHEAKIASLRERLARMGFDVTRGELVQELAEPTERFAGLVEEHVELARELASLRTDPAAPTPSIEARYAWAKMASGAVISHKRAHARTLSDRIDAVLTHRVFGLLVFATIMYVVFQSIYTLAQPLMDALKGVFTALGNWAGPHLEGIPLLRSLVVDGIIAGVGGVLVFLPQILILFFFISVLEGTGYLARAAFLMDRLLGWCGLNGRAFIPLLSSFACAIPGIMAARVMPDARSRLATILVAPLMSCSARLPVYVLLIGAVIKPRFGEAWAGATLFGMHLLGLVLAIPIAWFFNRNVVKGKRLPFLMELPPYQWPKWRDVGRAMWFRGRLFTKTAGTTIFAMSLLIWAAATFPRLAPREAALVPAGPRHEATVAAKSLEGSALGRFGHAIEPVFRPAGFDWRITTSILAAFPARETVVPSLGILFSLGKDQEAESGDLVGAIRTAKRDDGTPLFNAWNSVGMMVFFALCAQCFSTLATVARETGSRKWAWFMFGYMTTLAYVASVGIYQLGRWLGSAP